MRIYVSEHAHACLKLQAAIDNIPLTELMERIVKQLPAAELIEAQKEFERFADDPPEEEER